jgi:hypothetical protein
MKNRSLLIIIGALIIIVAGGAVIWYLASPLVLNKTVDEAFSFEPPSQGELAQMSETELKEMEAEFLATIPDEQDLAQMPEEDRQAIESKVMEMASVMPDKVMAESMPTEDQAAETGPVVVLQGQFKDADSFHKGSGRASVYQLLDGSHLLRLEEFSVTNGPDLHVLLAGHPSPTGRDDLGEYLDLGSLKGNMGNQNYEIPTDADLSQFKSIVIYCKPFHVVFSTATLG